MSYVEVARAASSLHTESTPVASEPPTQRVWAPDLSNACEVRAAPQGAAPEPTLFVTVPALLAARAVGHCPPLADAIWVDEKGARHFILPMKWFGQADVATWCDTGGAVPTPLGRMHNLGVRAMTEWAVEAVACCDQPDKVTDPDGGRLPRTLDDRAAVLTAVKLSSRGDATCARWHGGVWPARLLELCRQLRCTPSAVGVEVAGGELTVILRGGPAPDVLRGEGLDAVARAPPSMRQTDVVIRLPPGGGTARLTACPAGLAAFEAAVGSEVVWAGKLSQSGRRGDTFTRVAWVADGASATGMMVLDRGACVEWRPSITPAVKQAAAKTVERATTERVLLGILDAEARAFVRAGKLRDDAERAASAAVGARRQRLARGLVTHITEWLAWGMAADDADALATSVVRHALASDSGVDEFFAVTPGWSARAALAFVPTHARPQLSWAAQGGPAAGGSTAPEWSAGPAAMECDDEPGTLTALSCAPRTVPPFRVADATPNIAVLAPATYRPPAAMAPTFLDTIGTTATHHQPAPHGHPQPSIPPAAFAPAGPDRQHVPALTLPTAVPEVASPRVAHPQASHLGNETSRGRPRLPDGGIERRARSATSGLSGRRPHTFLDENGAPVPHVSFVRTVAAMDETVARRGFGLPNLAPEDLESEPDQASARGDEREHENFNFTHVNAEAGPSAATQ